MSSLITIGFWISTSICSSTSLILLLKYVGRTVKCKYTTTLSSFHFVATWGFLAILAATGKIKKITNVPLQKQILLAFLVVGSIVLMNFNLKANSIGFYQMSKLVCIPYMVVHKMIFHHQKFSTLELVSLTVLLIGVALFSVSDIEVNLLGTIYAIASILCTVFNQMYTESYQKEYEVSGNELQLCIAPLQIVMGFVSAFAIESFGDDGFLAHSFTVKESVLMGLTCVFAVGVNLSTFNLLGKTSSITYQVIGHVKTILLLILGYIFFPSKWESQFQMIKAYTGIVIALLGVFMYSKAKLGQKKKEDNEPLLPKAK